VQVPKSQTKEVLARAVAKGLLDTSYLDTELKQISPQKQISRKKKSRQARINALHKGYPSSSTSCEGKSEKKKSKI